jgi:hypothetical protein
MSVNQPVLTGPGAGRSVTYGTGSAAELKLSGDQSDGAWAVVDLRVRAGDRGCPDRRGTSAAIPG